MHFQVIVDTSVKVVINQDIKGVFPLFQGVTDIRAHLS